MNRLYVASLTCVRSDLNLGLPHHSGVVIEMAIHSALVTDMLQIAMNMLFFVNSSPSWCDQCVATAAGCEETRKIRVTPCGPGSVQLLQ